MDIKSKLERMEHDCMRVMKVQSVLAELASDEDQEVRYRAHECIGWSLSGALEIIRDGLDDADELVCTTCLEILGDIKDERSLTKIVSLLGNESSLVRAAAAVALGDIGCPVVTSDLEERLVEEDDEEVEVAIYAALYLLGRESYLVNLLDSLRSDYYRVRCASANLLISVVSSENREKILNHLSDALSVETTIAAASSIKGAIETIYKD